MRQLKGGIPESERAAEIQRVSEDFSDENEILEITDFYFRYRPIKTFEVGKVGETDDGKFFFEFHEVLVPKDERKIFELGYTEDGQEYKTDGSYTDYLKSKIAIDLYSEMYFKALETLRNRANVAGSLHDKLVLWFYKLLTIDVIYEHAFDIEFGGTSQLSYLTVDPKDILPLTKEAIQSRVLIGNPITDLEKTTDSEQYELLKELRAIDETKEKKLLGFARLEAARIRMEEIP